MEDGIRTVYTHLVSKVKFDIPEETVLGILAERCLDRNTPFSECDHVLVRLAYADMLRWLVLGPGKMNNTMESDNGWSHSGGGYELDSDDKKELKAEANAIYKKYEPSSVFGRSSSFRIMSFGIRKAQYGLDGHPLPHLIK